MNHARRVVSINNPSDEDLTKLKLQDFIPDDIGR